MVLAHPINIHTQNTLRRANGSVVPVVMGAVIPEGRVCLESWLPLPHRRSSTGKLNFNLVIPVVRGPSSVQEPKERAALNDKNSNNNLFMPVITPAPINPPTHPPPPPPTHITHPAVSP